MRNLLISVIALGMGSGQMGLAQDVIEDHTIFSGGGMRTLHGLEKELTDLYLGESEVAKFQRRFGSISRSFGDLVNWNFEDEGRQLGVAADLVTQVNKALKVRAETRHTTFRQFSADLHDARASASQDKADRLTVGARAKASKKLEAKFIEEERLAEQQLMEVMDELFLPGEMTKLLHYLLDKKPMNVVDVPLFAKHLRLTDKQSSLFALARKDALKAHLPPGLRDEKADPRAWIRSLHAAETSLNRDQLEEYYRVTGRIPPTGSLEDYFDSLPKNLQDQLCKGFPVFREIRDAGAVQ